MLAQKKLPQVNPVFGGLYYLFLSSIKKGSSKQHTTFPKKSLL
jgi:hypothetical protein